jgi:hypothetical protein
LAAKNFVCWSRRNSMSVEHRCHHSRTILEQAAGRVQVRPFV